jgi:hypothetical protein
VSNTFSNEIIHWCPVCQCPQHLAAILEHEETPAEVCDYITDVVFELAGEINLHTPEVLRAAWPLIMAQYEHTDATIMQPFFMAIRALAGEDGNEVISAINKTLRENEARGRGPKHLADEWPDTISGTEVVN